MAGLIMDLRDYQKEVIKEIKNKYSKKTEIHEIKHFGKILALRQRNENKNQS